MIYYPFASSFHIYRLEISVIRAEKTLHQQDDYEQRQAKQHRCGTEPADIHISEPVIEQVLQLVDIVVRIGTGNHIGLPEHLEAVQQRDDGYHRERGQQVRQGNITKAADRSGTVNPGSFVETGGDGIQAGQPQHHIITSIFPYIGADQNPEREGAAHEINRFSARGDEQPVQQPLLFEQYLPQQHHAGDRNCHW